MIFVHNYLIYLVNRCQKHFFFVFPYTLFLTFRPGVKINFSPGSIVHFLLQFLPLHSPTPTPTKANCRYLTGSEQKILRALAVIVDSVTKWENRKKVHGCENC